MNLLLDTHAFLWFYSGSPELSLNAKNIIEHPENDFFVSIASFWEITIKHSMGKLNLDASLDVFFTDVLNKGFNILPIDFQHLLQHSSLPLHHRDPFDRIIIGQAIAERMPVITCDSLFSTYTESTPLTIIW